MKGTPGSSAPTAEHAALLLKIGATMLGGALVGVVRKWNLLQRFREIAC